MNQRIIYFIFSLVVLFTVFLYLDEKVENQTEVSFLKENWKVIRFVPPKTTWCGEKDPAFSESLVQMEIFDRGWQKPPVFSVTNIDVNSQEKLTYEGNFNIKNTFSDMSVLRTKFIEVTTDPINESNCLKDDAPTFILSKDFLDISQDLPGKKMMIGKKLGSDSSRVIARIDAQIISPYTYLVDKFRANPITLRERQFFAYSGGFLSSIHLSGQGLDVRVENTAKKNQYDTYVNHWSRLTGERIVLPPDVGNQFENQIRSLRADLYPDEANGPGIKLSAETKNSIPEMTLEISHSQRYSWKLFIFAKIDWNGQSYRPILREIQPHFKESISYLKEETFQNFLQSALNVKNASRFERPNQKIQ